MDTIRCIGIKGWFATFGLRQKFSHNLAARENVDTLIVEVQTSKGSVGYGQALPRHYLTGETLESVTIDIRNYWWNYLSELEFSRGEGVSGIKRALEPLYQEADLCRHTASYAAVEIATLDAVASAIGLPLFSDKTPAILPLVGVITAGGRRNAYWLAKILHWMGYRHFKVKVGKDANADSRRLAAVRKAIGKNSWLAVDANQAWEENEALERIAELGKYGIAVVEEPLVKEVAMRTDFTILEEKTGVAVMADEMLCTQADARALTKRGSPSWWNIRLAKNGGFAGMAALAALAHENGRRIYGGILVGETSLLTAADRVAFLENTVECGEYGFPRVFLRGDPFRGGPGGSQGCFESNKRQRTGLGVSVIMPLIKKYGRLVLDLS